MGEAPLIKDLRELQASAAEAAAAVRRWNECWCGMDHARMEMDDEGNWVELPEEDE